MYSSIEEENRLLVIDKCYWPLLKLATQGIPIGIEASALTLEIINSLEPEWICSLKKQIDKGMIEFIGSGYSQLIGPLVPAKVNDWNQKIGLNVYKEILGIKPKIALVNEMAYSAGILEHYINNEYKAIIMEWNNPRKYHTEWKNDWRYFPQIVKGCCDNKISIIWADSIAFQKFQRMVHGDIEQDEYIEFLNSQIGRSSRYFPLYANDVEIFDFRPGRFKTEVELKKKEEWDKIFTLFEKLKNKKKFKFILPSQVLTGLSSKNGGNIIKLESTEQPIPVKKQEKYNINRWALTGRNDTYLNTLCYALYNYLHKEEINSLKMWKELCYLWSSDFRTHITNKRWNKVKKKVKGVSDRLRGKNILFSQIFSKRRKITIPFQSQKLKISRYRRLISIENSNFLIEFNQAKGMVINRCICKTYKSSPLFGTLEHGYYDDISLGADFFSGHAVIEQLGKHKITDLNQITKPNVFIQKHSVIVDFKSQNQDVQFSTNIIINKDHIIYQKNIKLPERTMQIIHPFNITFIPESWDHKSLYFATHNGGSSLEKFKFGEKEFAHGNILSSLISAKHGIGATNGLIRIGDKYKAIDFYHDPSLSAMIPSIVFRKDEGRKFFFRLQYSIQEIDETFKCSKNPSHFICSITIHLH